MKGSNGIQALDLVGRKLGPETVAARHGFSSRNSVILEKTAAMKSWRFTNQRA